MRRPAAAPRLQPRRAALALLALALALACAAPRAVSANKKNAPSSSAASLARERAEAAAALDGVTTPASASGPAAAPTAAQAAKLSAAELGVTAAHSGRTKGPSPRVGYLRLQPLLSSIDPLARARRTAVAPGLARAGRARSRRVLHASHARSLPQPPTLTRRQPRPRPLLSLARRCATTARRLATTSERAATPGSGWSTSKAACGASVRPSAAPRPHLPTRPAQPSARRADAPPCAAPPRHAAGATASRRASSAAR
jgi:hypothetical protein